ncbi:MAG: UDP-N-acetylmuramate dehydrogenase [Parcubacteria group bacterium]|nr:UDP-N-acetylmuramate dehydrogenase [Parcubacteria group bacterium]
MIQKFEKAVLLKDYTTFKIGGRAKYFFTANNREDIIEAIKWAKQESVPFFVLGGGSNLLVSDNGFDGLVIRIQNKEHRIESCNEDFDVCVFAEAGVKILQLLKLSNDEGLSGFEWAAGIPNITVGGAIYNVAGGFGVDTSDNVKEVEVLDTETLEIKKLTKDECEFDYKSSIFKTNPSLIILSALLVLKRKDKQEIKQEVLRVLKYRRDNHTPLPSAGCIFKNPDDKTAAGLLIKEVGLAGKIIGKAQISDKHSNFIVNLGGATANDVLELIKLIKTKIKEKFDIVLEEELRYLGF